MIYSSSDGQVESVQKPTEESYEHEEDEHGDTQCGSCGGKFNTDELWDVTCVKDGITIGINYGGISYWLFHNLELYFDVEQGPLSIKKPVIVESYSICLS
ncbi:hypothetical protein Tco_0502173 [Tanacetum coccineum]